jgi:hypothetical protein
VLFQFAGAVEVQLPAVGAPDFEVINSVQVLYL